MVYRCGENTKDKTWGSAKTYTVQQNKRNKIWQEIEVEIELDPN